MDQEVKTLLDNLGRDYTELHRLVGDMKSQLADRGWVDPLIKSQIDAVNAAINEREAKRDELVRELEAKLNRLSLASGDPKAIEEQRQQLERFNRELKSNAAINGRSAPDVDAAGYEAYRKAFATYLRRGDRGLMPEEQRAMSVGSDPDGGYTVTPDMTGRVVVRVFELSPIRQYATVETIGTDAYEGENETDDASGGWVAETGTRSDSNNPTIGKYRIVTHEQYAQPKSTQKLLEDSNRDIQAWLQRRTGNKFARLEAAAFTTGNGVTQPRGFASYTTAATADTSRSWGVFEHIASGTSGGFGTDPAGVQKLITTIHKLNPVYLPNAGWYLNRNTLSTVRQLTDASTTGKFVFVPSFQANVPDTLLGYPVRVLVDMVDIAANSLSVAFGDMAETYTVVDRVGMSLLVDPYTDKPNVRFYMRRRVGGDVVNFDSLKFIKFATS